MQRRKKTKLYWTHSKATRLESSAVFQGDTELTRVPPKGEGQLAHIKRSLSRACVCTVIQRVPEDLICLASALTIHMNGGGGRRAPDMSRLHETADGRLQLASASPRALGSCSASPRRLQSGFATSDGNIASSGSKEPGVDLSGICHQSQGIN